MKKAVNFKADENTIKKFKIMSNLQSKFIGGYLEELMKKEIKKWESENEVIQT